MRIAQINPGHMPIPPDKWGAVEKIIWYYKLESEKKGHQVDIKYIDQIQKGDYDIVHVHMGNHAMELYSKGIPYVFTFHDHHAYIYGKSSEVYDINIDAMKNAEISIVPAKYLVDYFEGIPVYLRHGINEEEYYHDDASDFTKLLIVGNNGIIGNNSFDRKGFRYAIEASEKLNLPITVVGPTNSNKEFFDSNPDLLKSNVTIHYDLNDKQLQEIYRSHSILIHASSVEAGHPPLTLLEAASSGLPIISTDCSGDLYTTKVNRDTDEIVDAVKNVLKLYALNRAKTLKSVQSFYWSNVVNDLLSLYEEILNPKKMKDSILSVYKKVQKIFAENKTFIHYVDGPFVEIKGQRDENYNVKFIDNSTQNVFYDVNIKNNNWARCGTKFFVDWKVQIKNESGKTSEYRLNLNQKRVFISLESSSLGDTLAWIPYVDEFRKKHNCYVIVSTFMNYLFKEKYPDIEFVEPGSVVHNLYALYRIGWFYDGDNPDYSKNKFDFTKIPLQKTATDILGLEYKEIRPRIKEIEPMKSDKPYICIANHSTAQPKYWNNETGWQDLVDYVKSLGYDVYLLSREEDGYMGNKNPNGVIKIDGKSLEEIGSILLGSKGFIGLGSGLSWFSWGLGIPTILISGFSEKYQEMSNGIYRIINESVCHGCFARHTFDKGDWNWCPDHKGTPRQFECTKQITFEMVRPSLDKMLGI